MKYANHEIAFLKWGTGNDEIGGPVQSDASNYCGKVGKLSLDGVGHIYINDPMNEKIIVLSADGKLLRVIDFRDSSKNVDVRNAFVDQYGNVYAHYADVQVEGLGVSLIYVKPNGERGSHSEKKLTKENLENLKEKLKKEEGLDDTLKDALPIRFLNSYNFFDDGANRKIVIKTNDVNKRLAKKKLHLDNDKIELNYGQFGDSVYCAIIGVDDDGNSYLLCGVRGDRIEGNSLLLDSLFVAIFSPQGKLLTKISLNFNSCETTSPRDYWCALNVRGDVFRLICINDGVHIFKWSAR